MPRPRIGRQRVEDCLTLRAADIVRRDELLGPDAFGSAELRDPATGRLAGTVTWQTEAFDGWAWLHVGHRRAGETWDAVSYRLDLDVAPRALGRRWRIWCPLSGRPARALYLPPGAERFGSREAHRLAYRSQGLSPARRAEARARRILVDLGGSSDLAAPFPERPKGMWSRTFARRSAELARAVEAAGTA